MHRSSVALMMAAMAAFPIGSAWGISHAAAASRTQAQAATATAPMERARSNFINSQAIPMLNQEALQAQSSQVNVISGATLTSEAYIASLHSALKKAKFPTT